MRSKYKRRYILVYLDPINFTKTWPPIYRPEIHYSAEVITKNYRTNISTPTKSSAATKTPQIWLSTTNSRLRWTTPTLPVPMDQHPTWNRNNPITPKTTPNLPRCLDNPRRRRGVPMNRSTCLLSPNLSRWWIACINRVRLCGAIPLRRVWIGWVMCAIPLFNSNEEMITISTLFSGTFIFYFWIFAIDSKASSLKGGLNMRTGLLMLDMGWELIVASWRKEDMLVNIEILVHMQFSIKLFAKVREWA